MSTIQISSCPNVIVNYDPICIPMPRSYRRSWFRYSFDLLSIKIDHFCFIFNVLIENRLKKWSIKRSKYLIKDQKVNLFKKVNLFWLFQSLSIYFDLFSISFDQFWSIGYSPDTIYVIDFKVQFGFGRWIWREKVN